MNINGNAKRLLDHVFYGKRENVLPQIRHLPRTTIHAMYEMFRNRQLDRRIRNRYYADKFVLIAALPKSASSLIGNCIADIMGQGGRTIRRRYAGYMLANQTSNLRAEMVKDFPQGGVLKYHTKPSGENLIVIELLHIPYIILLRHPADHLTAYCCNTQIEMRRKAFPPLTENCGIIPNHIYPVEKTHIHHARGIDDQIDYLINGGYLFNVLVFMADWMRFRSKNKSIIVTYEHFMNEKISFFNQIAKFLIGNELDQRTEHIVHQAIQQNPNQKEKKYPYAYKHGYTGKIGTWRDYFTEKHLNDYLRVTNAFIESYPNGNIIFDVYPDLMNL